MTSRNCEGRTSSWEERFGVCETSMTSWRKFWSNRSWRYERRLAFKVSFLSVHLLIEIPPELGGKQCNYDLFLVFITPQCCWRTPTRVALFTLINRWRHFWICIFKFNVIKQTFIIILIFFLTLSPLGIESSPLKCEPTNLPTDPKSLQLFSNFSRIYLG